MTAQELRNYLDTDPLPGTPLPVIEFYSGGKSVGLFDRGRVVSLHKIPAHSGLWELTMESEEWPGLLAMWYVAERWGDCIDIVDASAPPLKTSNSSYPHACPRCGKPAYIGFAKVDCSGGCR